MSTDPEFERVFTSSELARFTFAKSLLERDEIDYFSKNETEKNILGWAASGDFDPFPAELWVRAGDAHRARTLLRMLNEHPNER